MDPHTPAARGVDRAAPDAQGIERVAVVGAGTMGRGIAQLVAQSGAETRLIDPAPEALASARASLDEVLTMLERKGRLTEPADAVRARLSYHDGLDAAGGVQLAIEAAPERLELKRAIFARLSEVAPDAILATNTSTLPIARVAAGAARPERVAGLHFFNPAPLMPLVEVIPGLATEPGVIEALVAFGRRLGRDPVVAGDRPGFLVNRVARPYYGEALRLHGEGVPVATIDRALRAAGFPMGPFELLDLIGLDVNLAATESVYEAFFHEPRYRPHPLQRAMVDAGRLGRKSGRGFYAYGPGAEPDAGPPPRAERPGARPLRARVLGGGALADALRAHGLDEEGARLVVDLRRGGSAATGVDDGLPLAVGVGGRSASLASGSRGRERVGISFLPGADGVGAVELMAPEDGAGGALEAARAVFAEAGLEPLVLPDRAGGIAVRVLAMLANEAASALEEGLADAESIDRAMRLGVRYPLGPLAWSERLGLPFVLEVLEDLHAELGEDRYRPHPRLRRLVATGVRTWTPAPAGARGAFDEAACRMEAT